MKISWFRIETFLARLACMGGLCLVMAPENKLLGGAGAVKVLTVSGVQESLQTMPILLPPNKSKEKRSRIL